MYAAAQEVAKSQKNWQKRVARFVLSAPNYTVYPYVKTVLILVTCELSVPC